MEESLAELSEAAPKPLAHTSFEHWLDEGATAGGAAPGALRISEGDRGRYLAAGRELAAGEIIFPGFPRHDLSEQRGGERWMNWTRVLGIAARHSMLPLAATLAMAIQAGSSPPWGPLVGMLPSLEDLAPVTQWPKRLPSVQQVREVLFKDDRSSAFLAAGLGLTAQAARHVLAVASSRSISCNDQPTWSPAVALMNHGNGGVHNAGYGWGDCSLRAKRNVARGEPLTLNYGVRRCWSWLLTYGFVPPESSDVEEDTVALTLNPLSFSTDVDMGESFDFVVLEKAVRAQFHELDETWRCEEPFVFPPLPADMHRMLADAERSAAQVEAFSSPPSEGPSGGAQDSTSLGPTDEIEAAPSPPFAQPLQAAGPELHFQEGEETDLATSLLQVGGLGTSVSDRHESSEAKVIPEPVDGSEPGSGSQFHPPEPTETSIVTAASDQQEAPLVDSEPDVSERTQLGVALPEGAPLDQELEADNQPRTPRGEGAEVALDSSTSLSSARGFLPSPEPAETHQNTSTATSVVDAVARARFLALLQGSQGSSQQRLHDFCRQQREQEAQRLRLQIQRLAHVTPRCWWLRTAALNWSHMAELWKKVSGSSSQPEMSRFRRRERTLEELWRSRTTCDAAEAPQEHADPSCAPTAGDAEASSGENAGLASGLSSSSAQNESEKSREEAAGTQPISLTAEELQMLSSVLNPESSKSGAAVAKTLRAGCAPLEDFIAMSPPWPEPTEHQRVWWAAAQSCAARRLNILTGWARWFESGLTLT